MPRPINRFQYNPPPLSAKIILRDFANEPSVRTYTDGTEVQTDVHGRMILDPDKTIQEWGISVWSHRRDVSARSSEEQKLLLDVQRTIFTIRYRNLGTDFVVIHRGIEYRSVGPGLIKGGFGYGRAIEYLELVTERLT